LTYACSLRNWLISYDTDSKQCVRQQALFYVSVRNEESRRAGAVILEDRFKRYIEDVRDAADDFERRRVLIAFDTIEARRQAGAHLAPHISV
jgi:hypothetical protein